MQGNESRSLEVVKSDRKGLLWAGGGWVEGCVICVCRHPLEEATETLMPELMDMDSVRVPVLRHE